MRGKCSQGLRKNCDKRDDTRIGFQLCGTPFRTDRSQIPSKPERLVDSGVPVNRRKFGNFSHAANVFSRQ